MEEVKVEAKVEDEEKDMAKLPTKVLRSGKRA